MSNYNFVQVKDPVTKSFGWKMVPEDYDYYQEIATSCYGDMLHDDERNKKFGEALKLAIGKMHSRGKKANVLDIGTGTGLLAMLAVKHGADSVFACEMFLPVANTAEQIIAENGFAEQIKLIKKHSTALTVGTDGDLPYKVNILISEVFDTELIGEGAIWTFNHAHQNLLEEDCIVIPSKAIIYAKVVESALARKWNCLEDFNLENDQLRVPDPVRMCEGAASLHDIQLSQFPIDEQKALSNPLPIFRFDFKNKNGTPKNEHHAVEFKCLNSGRADVVFMWWDLVMDDDEKIILSCAPVWSHPDGASEKICNRPGNPARGIPWRDHWMQAVYFLNDNLKLQQEDSAILRAWHDEFSLWFSVDTKDKKAPVCICGLHLVASRSRIGAINDSKRRASLVSTIKEILLDRQIVVCLDGFSLLGIIAGKLGARRVLIYLHDDSPMALKLLQSFICLNGLSTVVSTFKSIDLLAAEIKKSSIKSTEMAIVGEPCFRESLLPWDNLLFWRLKDQLLSLIHMDPNQVLVSPEAMSLYGCAVAFDDLWKISRPLGTCMGLSMSLFDFLIKKAKERGQSSPEPQPLWEYPCLALSSPILLHKFHVKDHFLNEHFKGAIPRDTTGTVDGLVFWVKWHLFGGKTIECGPLKESVLGEYIQWDMYERQGVHFYRIPRDHLKEMCFDCELDTEEVELVFRFKD